MRPFEMNFADAARFVVATQVSDKKRMILRSYASPEEVDSRFSIVEVCLATTAMPLLFVPLPKFYGDRKEFFADGGFGIIAHSICSYRSTVFCGLLNRLALLLALEQEEQSRNL